MNRSIFSSAAFGFRNLLSFASTLILVASSSPLYAQPLTVPNQSFELQSTVGFPFDTNPTLDAWQKIAEPEWYGPAFGAFGIPWYGTSGTFSNNSPYNTAPYGNVLGNQAGYILMVPQVTLFQDFSTTPAFDATYEIGKSYNLTLGVWARSSVNPIAPGSTLAISLYYRDNLNNKVPINTTTISYSTSTFTPGAPNPNLIDFNLNIPTVQAGDAWAGKNIGIQLESTIPIEMTSFGNWDFDNLRLTAVPEPSALALLGMGVGGLILARTRRKG